MSEFNQEVQHLQAVTPAVKKNPTMASFMKGKARRVIEQEFVITKRFLDEEGQPIPFLMKPIDTELSDKIQDQCIKPVYNSKGKKIDEKMDATRFAARLAVESTVFPDFKDRELMSSYGVVDPVECAKAVLDIPGEYTEWLMVAQRVNGYDEESDLLGEMTEKAKN